MAASPGTAQLSHSAQVDDRFPLSSTHFAPRSAYAACQNRQKCAAMPHARIRLLNKHEIAHLHTGRSAGARRSAFLAQSRSSQGAVRIPVRCRAGFPIVARKATTKSRRPGCTARKIGGSPDGNAAWRRLVHRGPSWPCTLSQEGQPHYEERLRRREAIAATDVGHSFQGDIAVEVATAMNAGIHINCRAVSHACLAADGPSRAYKAARTV